MNLRRYRVLFVNPDRPALSLVVNADRAAAGAAACRFFTVRGAAAHAAGLNAGRPPGTVRAGWRYVVHPSPAGAAAPTPEPPNNQPRSSS